MKKIWIFTSIVLLESGALGMSQHYTKNEYKHYPKNYLHVIRHLDRIKHDLSSLSTDQRTVVNSWNNPVEALQALGLIELNCHKPPLFSKSSHQKIKPNQQKVLAKTEEWEKYINWNPEKASTSHSEEASQISTETDCVGELVNSQPENFLNIHQSMPQDPYRFMKKSPRSKLKCQHRLNRIYSLTKSFKRKDYLRIFPISNSRANRDFEYALETAKNIV